MLIYNARKLTVMEYGEVGYYITQHSRVIEVERRYLHKARNLDCITGRDTAELSVPATYTGDTESVCHVGQCDHSFVVSLLRWVVAGTGSILIDLN